MMLILLNNIREAEGDAMSNVTQDDLRALDILAAGSMPKEQVEGAQFKLGVDDDDVRAWRLSKTLQPEERDEVQSMILDKVRVKKPDAFKATVAGGLQGVSFGFSDEIKAAFDAGVKKIKTGASFTEEFEKNKKRERAELKELEEQYPLQFIGSELAGSVIVPIPGSAVRGGAAATKLLNRVGRLALESGVQAAGKSEADFLSKQFLEETAKGTTLGVGGGLLLGKLTKGASSLVQKGMKPTERAAKAVSSVLFDLPPAYTERLIDPRTAQKILDPKSPEQIVESITELTKDMGSHARALSKKAQEKISDTPSIDVRQVVDEIGQLPSTQKVMRSSLDEATKARSAGAKAVEDLAKRANEDGLISEKDLKRYIQDLDLEIPWNKFEWGRKDEILSDMRKFIDRSVLKAQNAEYREAMIPVDKIMSNLEDITKSFSLKRKGFRTVPSDATFSKVKSFFDVAGASKKPVTEKSLREAEQRFPDRASILEDIELSQIARRTQGGMPAGSKHVLQGLAAGTIFGAPVWGAVAGAVKDRFGRKFGQQLLPSLIPAINFSDDFLAKSLGRLDPAIVEAAFQTLGRTGSVRQGVEAAQTPSLLPTGPQSTFLPAR